MPVKNIIPGQKVTKEKQERARELRREMTPAEKILWEELRANKLGVHFRRQQVIQGFIVDFYCHPLRPSDTSPKYDGSSVVFGGGWVGAVHDLQKEEDERREKALSPSLCFGDAPRSALGLRIVRFRNDEVMRNVSAVVGKIRELL
jgi:very-short-patch-repair endonuclease